MWILQAEMEAFKDLQYCKTDLIATKGIVFCKHAKLASALMALEEIAERGTVGNSPAWITSFLMLLLLLSNAPWLSSTEASHVCAAIAGGSA